MSDPISALQDQLEEAASALGGVRCEIERLRAENDELRKGNHDTSHMTSERDAWRSLASQLQARLSRLEVRFKRATGVDVHE